MPYPCLVCAYPKLKEPPRSPGGGGSYEICPACGYQYGVDDDDKGITPEQWRAAWIKNGAHWSSTGIQPPKGWKYQPPVETKRRAPRKTAVIKTIVLKKRAPRKKS